MISSPYTRPLNSTDSQWAKHIHDMICNFSSIRILKTDPANFITKFKNLLKNKNDLDSNIYSMMSEEIHRVNEQR